MKNFKLYKIIRQIVPTSEMWTFRVADNVKQASNYRATRPDCHCHLSALPGLRFTATVLIAFEICSFQSQLAISIVSFVLLLWILYCLIKLFPYLAGKGMDYLAQRLSHTLSQVCRKHFKTGLETTNIKSNPQHCPLSTVWNQREQHSCQHWCCLKQCVLKFVSYQICKRLLLEKQWLFLSIYPKVWCLICTLHLFLRYGLIWWRRERTNQ